MVMLLGSDLLFGVAMGEQIAFAGTVPAGPHFGSRG
jgi:hypothetical protein